jgi:hypothetical protein
MLDHARKIVSGLHGPDGKRPVIVVDNTRTGLMSLAAGVGAKTTLGGVLPEWVVVLTGSVAGNVRGLLLARGLGAAYRARSAATWHPIRIVRVADASAFGFFLASGKAAA